MLFARRKRLLQKIIEAEQLDKLQCKPGTAEGFFIFDANAACVDFNPLDIESVVEWIVVEWIVVEQSGLNELRFALVIGWGLAFRCVFFFGDPLDAATGSNCLFSANWSCVTIAELLYFRYHEINCTST